ncbi:DUF2637 domain-containing protein [Nonomuraea aridisoli]|uniref:DUF2637 domain-containing protein n=1 Tax=Nonomuraea aridisoli TaxID=2070368 RepID=UPI0015E881C3|nr:DUF2637 domain-containing protein [Nonomuraea aridisoli]
MTATRDKTDDLAAPSPAAAPPRRRRWWRLPVVLRRRADDGIRPALPAAPGPADSPGPAAVPAPVPGGRAIRGWSIATILIVAIVGTAISSWHAFELVHGAGEPVPVALGYPLLIDGLIFMASMNILHAARYGGGKPVLAWVTLCLGALVTLAVNVAYGWDRGLLSQLISAIPPASVLLSYELLMKQIRMTSRRAAHAAHAAPAADAGHAEPPADEVAEPSAAPAPVARNLAEAVLALRATGESIRGVARAFEIPRSKVETIIRQAEDGGDEAADEPADDEADEVIARLRDSKPLPPVNGAAAGGSTLLRGSLGGGV